MLKIRTYPLEESKVTPINAIQLQINENIRMMAKLKERWAREKEEEGRIKSLPTYHTVATIQVVEDVQTFSTHHTPSPTGPINGDATTSTINEKYTNSAITPTTAIGAYKINVPCDYTSYNGELFPWHGLPGKEPDLWF